MTKKLFTSFAFFMPWLMLAVLAAAPLLAQQHIARRLGHPSTRFADPVHTIEELRDRLTSEGLVADIDVILNLHDGWQGRIEDFRYAAATAPVTALQIPVGASLPAMSSRKDGKPILVRNLIWGGEEPIDAYEFFFDSKGRRYRCVTPKICCNFWIEDLGPDGRAPVLMIECNTTDEVLVRRPVQVCLTVKNTGDAPEELVTVTLPVPDGAIFSKSGGEANTAAHRVIWRIRNLEPDASKLLCAHFIPQQLGSLTFASAAHGAIAQPVEAQCVTNVTGIPAVLLEVVDVDDPVEVHMQETYEISVINQGLTTLTNVKIVCTLEAHQEFVSGAGATSAQAQGRIITFAPLSTLAPKTTAKWQVVVKAIAAGDVRFATELTSDQFKRSINETEATRQY
ncbi:MAG: hypothetical protein DCC43_11925 [Candidatus Brocadia sp.]|jgi:hypothetical protein|uniref:DUF11 domain-containing protein n=1 Tax=Candidatus Brocadia fulgida TaxID=380242 RepID=A0A0M2UST4_9BACT|nr:MAG: hypothetical protein BROFUL_02185 [Candidatus Brocadia fulgida]MCC6324997.1 DUF11 domain-containing protein [Candidatus Brocadia sp.]MCE7912623.1 DUF11 domain-containing protein [Candidatus Brocadia sp. AMX3]OQZ00878.1 MAG: hypothetical protein B6D35_05200 [Candidatus Brocadia sp. UTAMX2]MBV6519653.1 hypothetical protein [Candidatus Brocadia fulgida]